MWRSDRGNRATICRSCVNERQRVQRAESGMGAAYYETWKEKNPDGYKQRYQRANAARYATPELKFESRMRNNIYRALKGIKKARSTFKMLGYTLEDLRRHLESQFADGMTWENYGDWHMDHKIALSTFRISGPEDPNVRIAWALDNLQPLWAHQNNRKTYPRTYR